MSNGYSKNALSGVMEGRHGLRRSHYHPGGMEIIMPRLAFTPGTNGLLLFAD
jgi:hypothetical protein